MPQYLSTDPPTPPPLPVGTDVVTVCYDSNGKATFPVTVVLAWHPDGKTVTLTFTRDSCQPVDVEPGSYAGGLEDQSGQSDDRGFTIAQP